MEPPINRHILSRLALWLPLLLFTTHTVALPSRPLLYSTTEDTTVDTNAKPSVDLNPHQTLVMPAKSEGDSGLPVVNTSGKASPVNVEATDSSYNVPCLHGFSTAEGQPREANDRQCAKPLALEQDSELRFGRKIHTRNRMLGDFDGLMVDYGVGGFALNGIAGFPSDSGNDKINPQKQLYGLSIASGRLASSWDLSGYLMNLQASDQDRRAFGGAIRHTQANRSLLISADYNQLSHSLSRLMVSSAWRLLPTTTLSSTLDIQRDYLPTPQNKYLQQTMALTEGWDWGLPLERITALSTSTSTDVYSLGFSVSHAFSKQIKLKSDFAILNVSNEVGASDMAAPESVSNEYYFHLKLTGKDLLVPGDKSEFTLRYDISESSRLSSSLLDGSYTMNHQWQLSPQLKIDYRDNLSDNSTQWSASPIVKLEYRLRKKSRVNLKATGEWMQRQDSIGKEYHSTYTVSLGYLTDF